MKLNRLIGVTAFLMVFSISTAHSQHTGNMWKTFEKVKFKDHYVEEYFSYAQLLVIDKDIKAFEGQEIVIEGYYIPVQEEGVLIVSKFPYSNCFFCGGAGLESVIEVEPHESVNIKKLKLDQKIKVKGKLKLNDSDWVRMAFIIENGRLI